MRQIFKGTRVVVAVIGIATIVTAGLWVRHRAGGWGRRSNSPSIHNVVLIIIDTLRADKLGCYGFGAQTSPELDAMARKGIRFDRVVAQSSWTRPSIGSMLTGLYPRTVGLYEERYDALDERFTTLAEVFQKEGFRTVGITANPNINSTFGFAQGFDIYEDSDVIWTWMRNQKGRATSETVRLRSARDIFRRAFELVRKEAERPHYVQLTLMEMHEYKERGQKTLLRREFDEGFTQHESQRYLRSLRQLSYDIGVFVDDLRSLPGWEKTLFVLASDHGEGLGDHPNVPSSSGHGAVIYESNTMVPLIFYLPGGNLGKGSVTQPVRLLDLMPTIADITGLPTPEDMQGVSLVPYLIGAGGEEGAARATGSSKGDTFESEAVGLPPYFVIETKYRVFDKIGVYSQRWAYIENRDVELYRRECGQPCLNAEELQKIGVKADGINTDAIEEEGQDAIPLREYLRQWEGKYREGMRRDAKWG